MSHWWNKMKTGYHSHSLRMRAIDFTVHATAMWFATRLNAKSCRQPACDLWSKLSSAHGKKHSNPTGMCLMSGQFLQGNLWRLRGGLPSCSSFTGNWPIYMLKWVRGRERKRDGAPHHLSCIEHSRSKERSSFFEGREWWFLPHIRCREEKGAERKTSMEEKVVSKFWEQGGTPMSLCSLSWVVQWIPDSLEDELLFP